jgi:Fe-S-cluster containining protein
MTTAYDDAVQALDALYAELPSVECKGKCATECREITMSAVEEQRIEAYRGAAIPDYGSDGVCPMLVDGRCSVYPVRPLLCRIYGASENLACAWCEPSRFLTRVEVQELLERSEAIGGGRAVRHFQRLVRRLAARR